jgi:SAM-dependent methyltransferase
VALDATLPVQISKDAPIILSRFTIGMKHELDLLDARTFHDLRVKNEIGHFTDVYDHEMYKTTEYQDTPTRVKELAAISQAPNYTKEYFVDPLEPLPEESVYKYAMRLLDAAHEHETPDFRSRINEVQSGKTSLRVLSLCVGAARIESSIHAISNRPINWTLQDINLELLKKARKKFPSDTQIEFVLGDLNSVHTFGETWDVIMCVSGLHHIVELERVLSAISRALSENGEFWLIGEYVGRSGNRLWPNAQKVADTIFTSLPNKYRRNAHTNVIDSNLPRNDYSIDCFEGIRAQEIETIISGRFKPLLIDRRNSFLWRLINLAYADNYDLGDIRDRETIASMVAAEVKNNREHNDGTELNAVYVRI